MRYLREYNNDEGFAELGFGGQRGGQPPTYIIYIYAYLGASRRFMY